MTTKDWTTVHAPTSTSYGISRQPSMKKPNQPAEPDYEEWLSNELWKIIEAVLLSGGVNPGQFDLLEDPGDIFDAIEDPSIRKQCNALYRDAKHATDTGSLQRYGQPVTIPRGGVRVYDPYTHRLIRPCDFVQWASARGEELPEELLEILNDRVGRAEVGDGTSDHGNQGGTVNDTPSADWIDRAIRAAKNVNSSQEARRQIVKVILDEACRRDSTVDRTAMGGTYSDLRRFLHLIPELWEYFEGVNIDTTKTNLTKHSNGKMIRPKIIGMRKGPFQMPQSMLDEARAHQGTSVNG